MKTWKLSADIGEKIMEGETQSETLGKRMKQIGNIWKYDEGKIYRNQYGNRYRFRN